MRCLLVAATAMVTLLGAGMASAQVTIGPGFDLFTTPGPGDLWEGGVWPTDLSWGTFVDVDFDGPGPQPPVRIPLEGGPSVGPFDTDTIVERKSGGTLSPSSPVTVDIELVELSLKSVAPVPIGPAQFDVFVEDVPGPGPLGQMTITKLPTADGGTFDAFLPVEAFVTFTEVGNPSNQFTVQDRQDFDIQNGVWSLVPRADDTHNSQLPSGGFYPGVVPPGAGPLPLPFPETGSQPDLGKFPSLEFATLAQHGVLPAQTPEPSTLLIWSLLAGLGIGAGWRRRR